MKVGDSIYAVSTSSNKTECFEATITSVGRKFYQIAQNNASYRQSIPVLIANNISKYWPHYRCYKSKQEYDDQQELSSLLIWISRNLRPLNLDQLRQIKSWIGEAEKNAIGMDAK